MGRPERRRAERAERRHGPLPYRDPELGNSIERALMDGDGSQPQGDVVTVGWLSGGMWHHEFGLSMLDLMDYDFRHARHLAAKGGGRISVQSSPRVAEGRTQLVMTWLTSEDHTESNWLLMLDDDMAFDGDLLERMMAVASYPERPIIGGLAFAGRHYGHQWPTIYEMYQDGESWGVRPVMDYPDNALVKCGGTGAACLLVHRQVYVGMANAPWNKTMADGRPNPYPWFVEGIVTHDGAPLGEDIAFCRKATLCQIPIHVHTGAKLGHMKVAPLTEATFRGQMAEELGAIERKIGSNEFEIVRNDLVLPDGTVVA